MRVVTQLRPQIALYRQILQLLQSGSPLPTLLNELCRNAAPGPRRQALERVAAHLRQGGHLADALDTAPLLFDPLTVELVRAGEHTGTLEPTLKHRVEQLEQTRKMALQLLMTFLYPAYLLGLGLLLGPLFDVAAVLQAGGDWNAARNAYLRSLATTLSTTLLVAGTLFFLPLLLAAAGWEGAWDRVRMRLPVVAPMYRELYAARFCGALGSALGSGLEAGQSLRLALRAMQSPSLSPGLELRAVAPVRAVRSAAVKRPTAQNARAPTTLTAAEQSLQGGASLADVVRSLRLLDETSMGSLSVAETTGNLPEQLDRLAQDHREASARRAKVVVALLFGICVIAGGIALAAQIIRSFAHTYDNLFKTMDEAART